MELIPLMAVMALVLASCFVGACLWALGAGQFDDLVTPAMRILKKDLHSLNMSQESERKKNEQTGK